VQPPSLLARFYRVTSKPHLTCKRLRRKQPLLLPEMILRLRWSVVNRNLIMMGLDFGIENLTAEELTDFANDTTEM
jgi:hypothetical protein